MRAPTLLSLALIAALGAQGAVCEWVCSDAGSPGMAMPMQGAPCHAASQEMPEPADHDGECPACEEAWPLLATRTFDGAPNVPSAQALSAVSYTFTAAGHSPRLIPRRSDLRPRPRDLLQITSSLRL
ncbi:MAG: hypothetical protein JRG76_14715 [Deltaproteobacteria bacterium]|nr:hypothetical protein [Deltaproteobacteria bacterium]